MSHTLYANLTLKSSRGGAYWWPLIFEAMHWHGFVFAFPQELHGKGTYIYFHYLPNELETEVVSRSFTDLWNEISSEQGSVNVLFQQVDTNLPFTVEIALNTKRDMFEVNLLFTLEGAELMSQPLEQAREKLKQVIACIKTLYLLCQPCTGEMYWYHVDDYAPWATLGKPLVLESSQRPSLREGGEQIVTQTFSEGYIQMLDRIPVPRKNGWLFIALDTM